MPRASGRGVEIEYETFGEAGAPTVMLINGLGSQMTRWPAPFCEMLVAKGLRAVRMDNRDTGKSTWFQPGDAYSLSDMAEDVAMVLDAAGAAKAHIVGVSMGGMIAQTVAIEHPDRVLSLTSIMSNTGNPDLPPAPAAGVLTSVPPDPKADWEGFVAHGMKNARIIGSPGFPWTDEELRERTESEYRRAYNPTGSQRQMGAIRAYGDRRPMLAHLKVPTLVLHGADDPLVPVAGGRDTAANIPGAELRIIEGMGHDMTPRLYPIFLDAILHSVARAS